MIQFVQSDCVVGFKIDASRMIGQESVVVGDLGPQSWYSSEVRVLMRCLFPNCLPLWSIVVMVLVGKLLAS